MLPNDTKGPPRPIIQMLIIGSAIVLWLIAMLVLVFEVPIVSRGIAQLLLTIGGFALIGLVLFYQIFRGPRI